MSAVLRADGLRVELLDGRAVVDDVSIAVAPGEILGLVGESGSGKTTLALALLGYARPGCRIVAGSVEVAGALLTGMSETAARAHRGKVVSYVPQDPSSSLNPSLRVGEAVSDMWREHGAAGSGGDEIVLTAFSRVGLPGERLFARRFPHELSGGQQQRVTIAAAVVCEPAAVVMDEPTTGLDVVTQARILEEVERLRSERGVAIVYVSHDLAVVGSIATRVAVMHAGRIVEQGAAAQVISWPRHAYTRALVSAVPRRDTPRETTADIAGAPILQVEHLYAAHGRVAVVEDVSLEVTQGACLAVVGESGSGKTTIARCVAGLHAPSAGLIRLRGEPLAARARSRTREQRRRLQIVFQNPYDSLNPRRRIRDEIARPARVLRGLSLGEANVEVAELLDRVRLPSRLAERYPRELSGGERQRVAIARALAARPEILVCDEITSALDVSVQAAVLELLRELRSELGLSLLFVSHDLGVVAAVADHVLVLETGQVREAGPTTRVLSTPQDAYTRRLLEAAPRLPSEAETS
ncbi:MAG TPA: ABC transporter ATP-binding protein [Gaiellaceae bacterium]|nr:ABC transporter ATP-binding protein [Gaiellaceae bacterium]